MSEFLTDHGTDVGNTFDSDFQQDTTFQDDYHDSYQDVPRMDINSFTGQDIFDSQDPLKHAHSYKCPPLDLNNGNQHFVNPHFVDDYTRSDGTHVDGYYRDGDGNTDVNRSKEEGGGYYRSNP
ncbi:hypothetical protein [Lentibacillus sp. Marseille-P4043]|uniref:hypothetical protein n=1 Tax=Lentibacillus sp. Marseille-P4043 TaxID=2040293 RepID=UPI000D0B9645|nr:hypothetical protein [Lentibacillus sp. Marseille-P4043]